MGVPLLFIGVFVGTVIGAANTGHAGKVVLGVAFGFVIGLASGVLSHAALLAAGASVAGIWLLLAPVAMIGGGVLGAWRGEHRHTSHGTAT